MWLVLDRSDQNSKYSFLINNLLSKKSCVKYIESFTETEML